MHLLSRNSILLGNVTNTQNDVFDEDLLALVRIADRMKNKKTRSHPTVLQGVIFRTRINKIGMEIRRDIYRLWNLKIEFD